MTIVVDGMGGDDAPEPVVHGVLAAAGRINGSIILVGITEHLEKFRPATGWPSNVTLHHASEIVEMDDKPTEALRKKKDSSISVGTRLVKEGHAQAFVSAGNTGAVTASALLTWRQIDGIRRPAIASVFPRRRGRFILLDAGASPDIDPVDLVGFAAMGRAYSEGVMGVRDPRVCLLNIGEEPGKGNAFSKQAFDLLDGAPWFDGNIESKDIFGDKADVVLCDAFTGNVLLKACEGVADFMMDEIRAAVPGWPMRALYLPMRKALAPLRKKVDYAEYGGSPLLGLNGTCIISHGRSNARAMENAVLTAARSVESGIVDRIRQSVAPDLPEVTA